MPSMNMHQTMPGPPQQPQATPALSPQATPALSPAPSGEPWWHQANPLADDEDFWWGLCLGYNPHKVNPDDLEDISKQRYATTTDYEDSCSICLENYKAQDVIITIPCKHSFHDGCLDMWIDQQTSCPLCRKDL